MPARQVIPKNGEMAIGARGPSHSAVVTVFVNWFAFARSLELKSDVGNDPIVPIPKRRMMNIFEISRFTITVSEAKRIPVANGGHSRLPLYGNRCAELLAEAFLTCQL